MQVNDKLIQFGQHVKKLRKAKRLTLTNLCYKNGLEPSTISRIEQGLVEPKLLTLVRLAKALDVDMNTLFEDGELI